MKTNNNIPAYRFQGYTDAWELRKLGELTSYRNGKGYEDNQSDFGKYELINLNSISIEGGLKPSGKFINSASETLNKNDLVMVLSDVGHGDLLGRVAIIPEDDRFVLNQRVALLRNNDYADCKYLFAYINANQHYFKLQGAGSSQLNISKKAVENFVVHIPSQQEQSAIGTFFSTLDRHITLHQRKLDTLKEQKKTYLKLLFPAKGQTKPALRFRGFEDDWELRKLGEISTHRGGTAIEKYFSEDGKYKVISIGSYGLDNKYIDQKIRAVENEVTRSKVVNKNELTMVLNDKTANGNIIGRCLLIETDDEFVINQRTEIISFNSVIYPKFAYVVLNGVFREQVKKIVQGGTQIYVNYTSVEQLYLSLPSLPEQEAIGTFFQTLDQEITQVEDKLASLKEMKKTLLRKLFV
ncbi:restriction endonuclease subunit S [Streptococcus iners]|uniref:Restriction endonuclease subunit S n=1 Tax=Streptococcus iners subsp. hyiners TaxID=3028083 RepID=A0AA96VJR0_9STRE|nr:restriction endonuclease subunit S [Streptococcus sp. 29892]MCK4029283.1 restriction endonuclease subunit S [Streptococcus suis]WNY49689.1 restriction endonuclease subunit S [Streptococcus sp. 29892]